MANSVLDASAVLAILFGEPGRDNVLQALANGASLTTTNYTEVLTTLLDRGKDLQVARDEVARLNLAIVEVDVDLAVRAAELRIVTKSAGLSLADRTCLALAQRDAVPALTADRNWSRADTKVDIQLIR